MSSLLIVNLGAVVTGDWRHPLHQASSLYIEDGRIAEIPSSRSDADTIIDARGLIAAPGLIDTHVHPTFGDFMPTQNSVGWQHAYLHGGVTSLVSAGELHVPGLPLENPEPRLFKYLAVLAKRCADNLPQKAPRLYAGTLLLTPGLTEADFDEIAQDGIGCVKFIFYPYEHYEYYQHMVVGADHSDLVPDRLVPKFAIAGTVAECREQVQQLAASGIHQVSIIPHTPDPGDRLGLVRTFAQEVWSALPG